MLWSIDSCQNKVSADEYNVGLGLEVITLGEKGAPGKAKFRRKLAPGALRVKYITRDSQK